MLALKIDDDLFKIMTITCIIYNHAILYHTMHAGGEWMAHDEATGG